MASENWPIPKFHFTVSWGGVDGIGFQEVTGLSMETQFIEYRAGNDPSYTMQKVPGLKKYETLTLKKGMFQGDSIFWDWWNDVQTNIERRETLTINLLDEEGNVVVTWEVVNAFPSKIQSTDLKSDANEVAVETLEVQHEGITQIMG